MHANLKKNIQLAHKPFWRKRKVFLWPMLLFSLLLLGFANYELATHSNNPWAFTASSTAIFLIVIVFLLLSEETRSGKKLIEQLQTQKESYSYNTGDSNVGIIITGKEGNIQYMNSTAETLTGWNLEEAKNLPLKIVYAVTNEETGETFEHIVSRILKTRQIIECENNTLLRAKNRKKLIIKNSGFPLFDVKGNLSGAVLFFNDITEEIKNAFELKESEKQYRTLFQNLPQPLYSCDERGYINLYNKAAVELWGKEPVTEKDRFCGALKTFNTDGTWLQPDRSPMAIAIKESKSVQAKEIIIQRHDGRFRHAITYPSPIFNSEGQLTGAVNLLLDVTDKKERDILVKQSEERYRNLIEHAPDAIFINDRQGKILEVNERAADLLGFSKNELLAMNIHSLFSEAEILARPFRSKDLLAGEHSNLERNIQHRDASQIPVSISATMIFDDCVMAIARPVNVMKK